MSERTAITTEDKIAVLKRVIALRAATHPKQYTDDYDIKVMQEILADYRGLNGK